MIENNILHRGKLAKKYLSDNKNALNSKSLVKHL